MAPACMPVCLYTTCMPSVTHYQFLWYVAHTFLPGRRHLCHLSSLLNPANYADILSQKVL